MNTKIRARHTSGSLARPDLPIHGTRGVRATVVKGAALASVAALLASCSSLDLPTTSAPAPSATATPTAKPVSAPKVGLGEKFHSGPFEVAVTRVNTGLTEYRVGMGMSPAKTKNGQLVVVRIEAKNIGMAPTPFGTENHQMVDNRSRHFAPEEVRGFGYRAAINPDAATRGVVIFDVAKTVQVSEVVVRADDQAPADRASTVVTLAP